jgi:hypothetical protein
MATLTKEGYFANLMHIREVLINELKHLDEKQDMFYVAEIAIKLRILYIDKSGTEALLKTIEKLYGFKINVLVGLSIEEKVKKGILSESLSKGLIFNQTNSVISWFGGGHGPKDIVSIFDAINKNNEIKINNNNYSYKDIIETVADKMGGAHIDEKISDQKLIPFFNDILIGGLSPAFRAIYDTARSSIVLINIIESCVSSGTENEFLTKVK